jgi:hypothetical protein
VERYDIHAGSWHQSTEENSCPSFSAARSAATPTAFEVIDGSICRSAGEAFAPGAS